MSRPRNELVVVVWAALAFGALLASYSAFRPVRDALILDDNPDKIPWLFTATAIVMFAVAPLWGGAATRRPRHAVPIAIQIFAGCLVVFVVVIRMNVAPIAVGRVFYVWSAVFNLFVVSVFWSLLADLLGPHVARRLYGPIAAGGTVGTLVGPALTKALVGTVGVAGVLVMSALLLEVAAIATLKLRHAARGIDVDAEDDAPIAGGALSGLRAVGRSPYLASIVGYVLCTACAATFVYLAQARITHDLLPDRVARTDFFASIDIWVSVVTLGMQLLVASPLLGWVGPGLVLCVLPLVQGVGITVLSYAPSLAAVAIVQVIARSSTHGLTRPARELLFTVVSRDEKYRAKNVIDTLVYRLGDVGSSWIAVSAALLVPIALPLSAAWIALAVGLGRGFRRRSSHEPS